MLSPSYSYTAPPRAQRRPSRDKRLAGEVQAEIGPERRRELGRVWRLRAEGVAIDPATGVADALLYWWRLGYDAESLSTRPDLDQGGPLSHWRCAACVLRPGLSVSAGDTARLACAVRFGCLEVLSAEVLSCE